MERLSPVLSLLIAAQSAAQVVSVRVPATGLVPGLGAAPSALTSAPLPAAAPALVTAPLAASVPLAAAPAAAAAPSAAVPLPAAAVPLRAAAPALAAPRPAASTPEGAGGGPASRSPESDRDAASRAFDGAAGTPAEDALLQRIGAELREHGARHGVAGLEGRLLRGLDPMGVLAVRETRTKLEAVARRLGASIEEVDAFTNELHVGGIWKNTALLADASAPKVKVWMIAAGATSRGGPVKDGDLTPAEFKADLDAVDRALDAAVADPEGAFAASKARLVARAREEFVLRDGVPVSNAGGGFLAMALNGYASGIVVDDEGRLPFVGAERLDYDALMRRRGLARAAREDRGRIKNFYVDRDGREVVKEVYPGLAIVLNGDMELAQEMARDAARPAAPEETPRLNLPAKTFTLPNGLTVVVHTDKTSPVVAVSITYKVGSQHETEGLSGFAHLFEHLMAQGTKSMKPREISRIIEGAGGVRNAYTMRTNTTYHSVVPKSALKTVLWAEAERMSTLNVDERALALEQQVVLEEMRLRYTNAPYAKARDAGMAETAFSRWENRHTTIGEDADVRNARLEDVRAFYRAHYAPNNAVIALAGDVTEEEARALVGRFFGPLERREIAAKPALDEAPIDGEKHRVVEDKFAKVPLLMAGWRAPERGTKDYWALTVLAEVLGAGDESPLYRALVKESKLALSVSPNYPWWTSQKNPGGPDLFGLMAPLKPGSSVDAVLAVVDRVLARFAADGLDAASLDAAKARLELEWTKDLEQLIDRAKTLSSYAALVGDPAGLSRDLSALLSITSDDVRGAVSRWLVGQGRAVVEARPAPGLELPADRTTPPIPAERPRPAGDPRPEMDAQRAGPLPAIERFTLSNGLRVVVVKDSRLPLLEARLDLDGGRLAERAGEEGLSGAVSELMTSGVNGHDAKAVAARLSRLGWKLETSRALESFSLDAAGLSRNTGEFFAAVADILAGADYPADEVALWKENKAEELKMQRAKPDFLSGERVKAELFGAHPYGRPALTDAQLAAIDREKILAFHRRALSPAGATLVVTGDADPGALRAQLEAAFARWSAPSAAVPAPALPARRPAALSIVYRPGSKQANLTIAQAVALRPGDRDWLAFSVMTQILGGSATSRLFLNLRVDKGYTYGAYARAATLRRGALWTATAEVRNEVAAAALTEMRKEIARMRDEDVPEETLAAVKRYLAGLFLLRNSSIDTQADALSSYERDGRVAETELATYLERLDALTPADIRRVARTYLDPETMATVAVGDEKTLTPALTR